MTKSKKKITPQYLYKNKKVSQVYLTIEDYEAFMKKLKKLSLEARNLLKK